MSRYILQVLLYWLRNILQVPSFWNRPLRTRYSPWITWTIRLKCWPLILSFHLTMGWLLNENTNRYSLSLHYYCFINFCSHWVGCIKFSQIVVLVIWHLPSTKVVGGNLYGWACTWDGMPLPSNNHIELNSTGSWL